MPLIQFNIPKDTNKQIEHFMIDHEIEDKREAIIQILQKFFKKLK